MSLETILSAGITATLVSLAVTFLFRFADQLKPSWAVFPRSSSWEIDTAEDYRGGPHYRLMVSNIGSGPARQLSVIGVYCDNSYASGYKGATREPINFSLVNVGEHLEITVIPLMSEWRHARILLTWSEPRMLWYGVKKRHWSLKLSKHFRALQDPYPPSIERNAKEHHASEWLRQFHETLHDKEMRLKKAGEVQQVSSIPFKRHCQFRKMRKKGWLWSNQRPD